MSWMDSWSRPQKGQATPAPYYLTHPTHPYCHTCGRSIGSRRIKSSGTTEAKYCSERCKRHKPSLLNPTSLERRIADALTALLQGDELPVPVPSQAGSVVEVHDDDDDDDDDRDRDESHPGRQRGITTVRAKDRGKKGDPRVTLALSELELAVFGDRSDPEKVYGRRKNRRARALPDGESEENGRDEPVSARSYDTAGSLTDESEDDDDDDEEAEEEKGEEEVRHGAGETSGMTTNDHVRAPQGQSEINFSVGGERGWGEKIEETPEMLARRREGQKRAEERELVRNVARRAVVFGLEVSEAFSPVTNGKHKSPTKSRKKSKINRHEDGSDEDDGTNDENAKANANRRKCEAVMSGQVIEPSFAKGDWSLRFRED